MLQRYSEVYVLFIHSWKLLYTVNHILKKHDESKLCASKFNPLIWKHYNFFPPDMKSDVVFSIPFSGYHILTIMAKIGTFQKNSKSWISYFETICISLPQGRCGIWQVTDATGYFLKCPFALCNNVLLGFRIEFSLEYSECTILILLSDFLQSFFSKVFILLIQCLYIC